MAKRVTKKKVTKTPIESYDHRDKKRANNPPVGLVTPETDPDKGKKARCQYGPRLDPQLVWAGKAEHTSFEVPTVSLHVHERIDPKTIVEAKRKRNGDGAPETDVCLVLPNGRLDRGFKCDANDHRDHAWDNARQGVPVTWRA